MQFDIDSFNPFSDSLSNITERINNSIVFLNKKINNSKFKDEFEVIELQLLFIDLPLNSLTKDKLKDLNNQLLLASKELSNDTFNSNIFSNIKKDIIWIKNSAKEKKEIISSAVSEKNEFNMDAILSNIEKNFWSDSIEYIEAWMILDKLRNLPDVNKDKETLSLFKALQNTTDSEKFYISLNTLTKKYKDNKWEEQKEEKKEEKNSSKDFFSIDYFKDKDINSMDMAELALLAYMLMMWAFSWKRNIRDIINVNFWDQISKLDVRESSKILEDMNRWNLTDKQIKLLEKELFLADIKKYGSWDYLNEFTSKINILELSWNSSAKQDQYINRIDNLRKAKDFFYDNPEKLKQLSDLESSWYKWRLQSNSKSFWMHFYGIITSESVIDKGVNIFIKPVIWEYAWKVIEITNKYVEKWWDGIKLLYETTKVDRKMEVNKDNKTDFLKWVFLLIESNPNLWTKEKENIIININSYINDATSNRISNKDRILIELNRLMQWYESKMSMLDKIDSELNSLNQREVTIETLTWLDRFESDLKKYSGIDYVLTKRENFIKRRKLNKIKEMIHTSELILNEKDFETVVKNIRNWIDALDWINTTTPNLWIPGDLENRANEVWWKLKEAKEFMTKDSFLENVKSFISLDWTISNDQEKDRMDRILKYQNMLEAWKINVSKEQAKLDIIKISKWNLPFFEAIDIINEEIEKSTTTDAEKVWLEILKEKINNWRELIIVNNWEWTKTELVQAIIDFKSWNYVDKNINILDLEVENILKRWTEMSKNILKKNDEIARLFTEDTFKIDMKLRQIREIIAWRTYGFPMDKINDLFSKVETNNYTKWHFLYLATNIIELNTVSQTFINSTEQEAKEIEYKDRNVKNNEIWEANNIYIQSELAWIKWETILEKKIEKFTKLEQIIKLIENWDLKDFINKDTYTSLKREFDILEKKINLLKKNSEQAEKDKIKAEKRNIKAKLKKELERIKELKEIISNDIKEIREKIKDINKIKTTIESFLIGTSTEELKDFWTMLYKRKIINEDLPQMEPNLLTRLQNKVLEIDKKLKDLDYDILKICVKSGLRYGDFPELIKKDEWVKKYFNILGKVVAEGNIHKWINETADNISTKYWIDKKDIKKLIREEVNKLRTIKKAENATKPK